MKISFTIPIKPCAWQRAGKSGKTHFTPAKTAKFESAIRLYASQAMADKAILDEPLEVTLCFFHALPKSAKKYEKEGVDKGMFYGKTTKPDIDNLAKAVLDGMNGVVYRDDALIWRLGVMKVYHKNDEIQINVSTTNDEEE